MPASGRYRQKRGPPFTANPLYATCGKYGHQQ